MEFTRCLDWRDDPDPYARIAATASIGAGRYEIHHGWRPYEAFEVFIAHPELGTTLRYRGTVKTLDEAKTVAETDYAKWGIA